MKTGSRQRLLSEGLSGGPGNVSRLTWANRKTTPQHPPGVAIIWEFQRPDKRPLSNNTASRGGENGKPFTVQWLDDILF